MEAEAMVAKVGLFINFILIIMIIMEAEAMSAKVGFYSSSSTSLTNLFLMTSHSLTSSMDRSQPRPYIASPLSQYHPCPSKCPHYTIFTNIRVITMTRQDKDFLEMIILTSWMTRNSCPGSRERKKPSQCSFEGSLRRYFQFQVQLQPFWGLQEKMIFVIFKSFAFNARQDSL